MTCHHLDVEHMKPMTEDDKDTRSEIAALREELERLNSHRFVRIHNSMPRLMMFQFVRGLVTGLGTVVGATLLVSVLVFILAQINFIPIIGDWAAQIADQIRIRE